MIKNGYELGSMPTRIVIRKADLDTCLAALILGAREGDEVVVAPGGAAPGELADPGVLCIEAGGSGEPHRGNFDHHDPRRPLKPACRQAYDHFRLDDEKLSRLVDYVCLVDEDPSGHPPVPFPSLSNLFSGMMLTEKDPLRRFWKGVGLLREILADDLDPFGTMPDRPHWRSWRETKEANRRLVGEMSSLIRTLTTRGGRRVGVLTSTAIGGLGLIYGQGCEIGVLYNPAFGDPPLPKFTIGGNGVAVSPLLGPLGSLEEGWGGRETIIGSPPSGSALPLEKVLSLIERHL